MQKIILMTVLLIVAAAAKLSAQKVPYSDQWSFRQDALNSYELKQDKSSEFINEEVYSIKSLKSKIYGFGNIMKTMKSDTYLGKTIKMTGYVKSDHVKNWAGLWMRVDYYGTAVLAFDNMRSRAIRRTTDWSKYEVILFVPQEATSISYGVLLQGTGQIWFKDVTFEIVDESASETGSIKGREHKVISFEKRAKAIASEIKKITEEEKNALKAEIDAIDKELAQGMISKEKADELKLAKASIHAAAIESKVTVQEARLNQLIQDQINGVVKEDKSTVSGGRMVVIGGSTNEIGENQTEFNLGSMKVYNGQEDKQNRQSKRTTSQIVFATGLNNVMTDGSLKKSDFRYLGSHFYEWGLTYNSRILKDNNLLHAKYGFSLMYNNLRATDNRFFAVDGKQANLELNTIKQEDSRFRNVNLVFPLHLEFDFSKAREIDDKTYYKTHDSFRLGVGGYIGTNLKSKQYIKYDLDEYKTKQITKGDFNVDPFIYGLSTYIGYGATSLYFKYDLNPIFKNNAVKQNNVSMGIRFDLN